MNLNDPKLLEFVLHEKQLKLVTEEIAAVADILLAGKEEDKDQFIVKLKTKLEHPLDDSVIKRLKDLQVEVEREEKNAFYLNVNAIKDLWTILVEKSIIALRFFDKREPYQTHNKTPKAYGIEELDKYFNKYAEFEGLLYGSSKSYRDHVIHVFRTWLVGIHILLHEYEKGQLLINLIGADIVIDDQPKRREDEGVEKKAEKAGEAEKQQDIFNFFEKLSMWTLTAMCHDLGYPLEKAQQVFNKTNEMLDYFITNSKSSLDVSFSGVQDYINDYIVKFISSKMVTRFSNDNAGEGYVFTGRVQPKYYIKFSKSLEKYSHGIVSSIILYKSLVYFLEAEFNVNEDYYYNKEECKQYYVRREILRSIASHTCPDIYHLSSTSLNFLLIMCDDLQEWDRKKWGDFYKGKNLDERDVELEEFTPNSVKIKETIKKLNKKEIVSVIESTYRQYEYYKKLYRDGLDTIKRTFSLQKSFIIDVAKEPEMKYTATFRIPKESSGDYKIQANKEETATFLKGQLEGRFKVSVEAGGKGLIIEQRLPH